MPPAFLISFNIPAQQIILPVDAYKICVLSRNRPIEIGFTSLSLVYGIKFLVFRLEGDTRPDLPTDLTAFSFIVYLVFRSNRYQRRMPLLKTIAQDATFYFLIIFTSHLALELTLFAARVRMLSYIPSLCGLLRDLQPTLQLVPAA